MNNFKKIRTQIKEFQEKWNTNQEVKQIVNIEQRINET